MYFKVNGGDISWKHIVDVYEWDLLRNPDVLGLRMLPKLTEDHINLQPRSRMKVKLAAQVCQKFVILPNFPRKVRHSILIGIG